MAYTSRIVTWSMTSRVQSCYSELTVAVNSVINWSFFLLYNACSNLFFHTCISLYSPVWSLTAHRKNACMLCASISCWARLFLQHLRRRALWKIRKTDERWTPRLTWNFSDCSVVLRFVFLTQQQQLNCVDVLISNALRRLPLPGRLSTVMYR